MTQIIDTYDNAYHFGWIFNDCDLIEKEILYLFSSENINAVEYIINEKIKKNSKNNNKDEDKDDEYKSDEYKDDEYKSDEDDYEKIDNLIFPAFDTKLIKLWIRGYVEGNGQINYNLSKLIIKSNSKSIIEKIIKYSKYPHTIENYDNEFNLIYTDSNCIDFLGWLFKDNKDYIYKNYKNSLYNDFITILKRNEYIDQLCLPKCYIYKNNPLAVIPNKKNESDVGYDLTIISEYKKQGTNTIMYDTGISIKIELGYYTEIVPRSSLSKSGYMLANSIGIIDQSYTGNLYIVLTKIDPNALDLVLPFTCCQLIIRKQYHVEMIKIDSENTEKTTRGNGGFGSTN